MKLQSITFRCAEAQLKRVKTAMNNLACPNRTILLSAALEDFLNFAEQKSVKEMNLFEMVQHIDSIGSTHRFSTQAK